MEILFKIIVYSVLRALKVKIHTLGFGRTLQDLSVYLAILIDIHEHCL